MLLAQAPRIWLLASSPKEDLGDEDVFISWPSKLFQGLSHFKFALAIGVDLGGVEGVYTILPCGLQAVFDDAALLSTTVREPAAFVLIRYVHMNQVRWFAYRERRWRL